MTEAQMKKKMAKIEKQMEKLGDEVHAVDPINKKALRWLVVSMVGYVTGLVFVNFNLLAGLMVIIAAVIAWSLHRSYEKEADAILKELSEKSAKLAKEHLHLRVRSDPEGFIKSILEGTLND